MRVRRAIPLPLGAAAIVVPAALAAATARIAALYRARAGFPSRPPVAGTPGDLGLPWEAALVPSAGVLLPAWFIPAPEPPGSAPAARAARASVPAATAAVSGDGPVPPATADRRPGVVLVHGWGSNRARMLPVAAFLHAAGFHALLIDVRGHGDNPPETLPVTGVEFGEDAAAAVDVLAARPDVSAVGVLGHSMGGVGAAIASVARPAVAAVALLSAPADPRLLVRETFRMADVRLPDVVATPLAWASLRAVLRPRRHSPAGASASRAVAATGAAVLVVQGDADEALPLRDLWALARAAVSRGPGKVTEVLVVPGGRHRWLYEDRGVRATVAGFLARALPGAADPAWAAQAAAAVAATRPPDTEGSLVPKEAHGHDHGHRHDPDGPSVLA